MKLAVIPLNRFARLKRQHKAYSMTYLMDVKHMRTSIQSGDILDLLKDLRCPKSLLNNTRRVFLNQNREPDNEEARLRIKWFG